MTWNYKLRQTPFSPKLLRDDVFFFLIITEMKVEHVSMFSDFNLMYSQGVHSQWDIHECGPTQVSHGFLKLPDFHFPFPTVSYSQIGVI